MSLHIFSHVLDLSKISAHRYYSPYGRAPDDKEICQIDAIDVTPDHNVMVLMDSNNKKLKVFDYMLTYRAAYSFESSEIGPKALAVLNNDEVVVSVYAETRPLWTKLLILNISGKDITYSQSVPVESLIIRAIVCHQDKIFIAGKNIRHADHPFVKLIDRDGNRYWSTTTKDINNKKRMSLIYDLLVKPWKSVRFRGWRQ